MLVFINNLYVKKIAGSLMVTTLFLSVLATSTAVMAADVLEPVSPEERMLQPAVSGLNAKLEAAYLHLDFNSDNNSGFNPAGDGHGYLLQGAVSMPLGQSFGLQIDAGALNADLDRGDVDAQGIGGHLFWRDPSIGLIGGYAHHVSYDGDVDTTRYGMEVEAYRGQFTFEGFVGVDHLDTPLGDDDFFGGEATIAWYATDNFRVSAGLHHSFDQTAGVIGFEAMQENDRYSPAVFANASFGEDDTVLSAGLRVYFGQSKSLKAKHREDDPGIGLFDNFGSLAACLNDIEVIASRISARIGPSSPTAIQPSFDDCKTKTPLVIDN